MATKIASQSQWTSFGYKQTTRLLPVWNRVHIITSWLLLLSVSSLRDVHCVNQLAQSFSDDQLWGVLTQDAGRYQVSLDFFNFNTMWNLTKWLSSSFLTFFNILTLCYKDCHICVSERNYVTMPQMFLHFCSHYLLFSGHSQIFWL